MEESFTFLLSAVKLYSIYSVFESSGKFSSFSSSLNRRWRKKNFLNNFPSRQIANGIIIFYIQPRPFSVANNEGERITQFSMIKLKFKLFYLLFHRSHINRILFPWNVFHQIVKMWDCWSFRECWLDLVCVFQQGNDDINYVLVTVDGERERIMIQLIFL